MFQNDATYEGRMQTLRSYQCRTLAHLFNLTLPGLVGAVTRTLNVDDDVRLSLSQELFILMEDYVEFQFSFLSSKSAAVLYESALRLFMGM